MSSGWNRLPSAERLRLSREALHHAAETIADQAETLAREMDAGSLADHGGAEALRLLAAVVRIGHEDGLDGAGWAVPTIGHA
jgi:hypothetical protein